MTRECVFISSRKIETVKGDRYVIEFVPLDWLFGCRAYVDPSYVSESCNARTDVCDVVENLKPFSHCKIDFTYKRVDGKTFYNVYKVRKSDLSY